MRYSHQRETIKKVVYGTDSHPTAEWVFRKTKNFIPKISLGTVYRNLKVLAEMGQISVINDDKTIPGAVLFQTKRGYQGLLRL